MEPSRLLGASARRGSLSAFEISVALSRPGSASMISFAQKDRIIVYKFVSDCLDMINIWY